MLIYRCISENFVKYVNAGELEAGNMNFDYAKLDDESAEEARGIWCSQRDILFCPASYSAM